MVKILLPLGCILLFYKKEHILVLILRMFFNSFLVIYIISSGYGRYSAFMLDTLGFVIVLLSL
jgi:hypothetical protein